MVTLSLYTYKMARVRLCACLRAWSDTEALGQRGFNNSTAFHGTVRLCTCLRPWNDIEAIGHK